MTVEAEVRNFTINFGPVHPSAHGVLRLILELDGGVHILRKDKDAARDAWLTARAGFTVLRFDNEAVLDNPAVVLEAVRNHAARTH